MSVTVRFNDSDSIVISRLDETLLIVGNDFEQVRTDAVLLPLVKAILTRLKENLPCAAEYIVGDVGLIVNGKLRALPITPDELATCNYNDILVP